MHAFSFILLTAIVIVAVNGAATNTRIIGGTLAPAGRFKYLAAVYKTTSTGIFFCGAALVTRQHVLSAGHCVADGIQWTINLGSNKLDVDDPNRLTLSSDFATIHNMYNPDTFENDIALIKFRSLIEFTEYIQPIGYTSNDIDITKPTLAIGWGQTSDQSTGLETDLRYVELIGITNEECSLTFGDFIKDNMLCAVGNNNEGFCNGDSGGPLVQELPSGEEVIVGIASFLSANGCESSDPGGYTRTFPLQVWIKAIIENV